MHRRLRISRLKVILLALFTLFWLIIGRGLFGSLGWISFAIVLYSPSYVVALIILLAVGKTSVNKKGKKVFSELSSICILVTFISLMIGGLFIVDGGDAGTPQSVATILLGNWFANISYVVSVIFVFFAPAAYLVTIIVMLIERFARRQPSQPTDVSKIVKS